MTTPMPLHIRIVNMVAWTLIFGGVIGMGAVMFGAKMVDPDLSAMTMIRVFILEACCFGTIIAGKMMVDEVSDWHMANLRRAVVKHGPRLFER